MDETTERPYDNVKAETKSRRYCLRIGCLLPIIVLLASIVVIDLYPVLTLNSRHKQLRQIAQPGLPWDVVKPELEAQYFSVMFFSPEFEKTILVPPRQSLLETWYTRLIYNVLPAPKAVEYHERKIASWYSIIFLNSDDIIDRVEYDKPSP